MLITKEIYDLYIEKSFFTEKNFSGKYAPKFLSANMIPSSNLKQFYYQTAFLVNLYSSLFIELKNYENTISNNIVKFTKAIENLQIELDSTCFTDIDSCSLGTYKLSNFDTTSYLFKFYYKTFEQHFTTGDSQSYLYTATGDNATASNAYTNTYSNILPRYAPIFTDQAYISTAGDGNSGLSFNKKDISLGGGEIIISKKDIQNIPKNKIADEIRQILLQEPENILGFLLYKKLYYNIILYNISIQNVIRTNYLNDNAEVNDSSTPKTGNILNISRSIITVDYTIDNLNTNCIKIGGTCPTGLNTIIKNKVTEIYNSINSNITNITTLNEQHFIKDNDNYLIEKNKYKNKIISLNTLRDEYIKTQDKLNISSKLYNQQLKNYNSIKTYATYIIIILIIIILFIISISIFPVFSKNTNNAIYIIALIILIVITFLYYTNFKYVNLYENFASISMTAHLESGTYLPIKIFTATNNIDNKIHAAVYNSLQAKMNEYINAYTDLLNNIRVNINTVGSKTFSQDANIYLYNLYLEKKRQVEFNHIKLTNLFNMIEVIKKQINYLFNIIFTIACFLIIILIALVLYSTIPELYIFVIILCVILITILMIYFAYAIIQPTRMVANKNYWASLNPSKKAIGKL